MERNCPVNEPVKNRDEESCYISTLAIDQYRREVAWIETEPLTVEEETRLLQRVQRGKVERSKPCPNPWVLSEAKHARDRLIEVYQPVVIKAAQRYARRAKSHELLDLVQEGNLGLMRALDRDDLVRMEQRRGFLYEKIRYAILSAVRDRDELVRLPIQVDAALSKMRKARGLVAERIGRHPTRKEVASALQATEQEVSQLQQWERCRYVESLNVLLCEQDAEDWVQVTSLYEAHAQTGSAFHHCSTLLAQALVTVLSPRQQEVIRLRYGFEGRQGDGLGQRKVAQLLGVLDSSVYKSERAAKEKLRQVLEPVIAQGGAQ
jgi:RNA polymerase sigma factor (sigma-70 family)